MQVWLMIVVNLFWRETVLGTEPQPLHIRFATWTPYSFLETGTHSTT